MRVTAFVHRCLRSDLVLRCEIEPRVFFGRRATSCDQDLVRAESDSGRALVELVGAAIGKLFDLPFVLIHIVAEANL